MKLLFNKKRGNIALTTVILVSSILVLGGLTLIASSVDYSASVKGFSKAPLADTLSDSCFEDSMYRLKLNKTFTGTTNLTLGTNQCSTNIQNDAGNNSIKIITITSTLDNYTFNKVKRVDVSGSKYVVLK